MQNNRYSASHYYLCRSNSSGWKTTGNTPEWTYNGTVRYEQPVALDNWNFILMTDYRWIDDRFLEATNQLFEKADDYWVVICVLL